MFDPQSLFPLVQSAYTLIKKLLAIEIKYHVNNKYKFLISQWVVSCSGLPKVGENLTPITTTTSPMVLLSTYYPP